MFRVAGFVTDGVAAIRGSTALPKAAALALLLKSATLRAESSRCSRSVAAGEGTASASDASGIAGGGVATGAGGREVVVGGATAALGCASPLAVPAGDNCVVGASGET